MTSLLFSFPGCGNSVFLIIFVLLPEEILQPERTFKSAFFNCPVNRTAVFFCFRGMQRSNSEIIPDQRVNKTGFFVKWICTWLTFPVTDTSSFGRICIEFLLATVTDQSNWRHLVFNHLMIHADRELGSIFLHGFSICRNSTGFPQLLIKNCISTPNRAWWRAVIDKTVTIDKNGNLRVNFSSFGNIPALFFLMILWPLQ